MITEKHRSAEKHRGTGFRDTPDPGPLRGLLTALDAASRDRGVAPACVMAPPRPTRDDAATVTPLDTLPGTPVAWLAALALADDIDPGSPRVRGRLPSAGGRNSVEFRFGWADGVTHRYDPARHALISAPGTVPGDGPPRSVSLRVHPARLTSKYGARALPTLLADVGHAVAHLLAAARLGGLPRPRIGVEVAAPEDAPDPAPDVTAALAALVPEILPPTLVAAVDRACATVRIADLRARRSTPLPVRSGPEAIPHRVADAVETVAAYRPGLVVGFVDGPRCGATLVAATGQTGLAGTSCAILVAARPAGPHTDPGAYAADRVAAGAIAALAGLTATGEGTAARTITGFDAIDVGAPGDPRLVTLGVVLGAPDADPRRRRRNR